MAHTRKPMQSPNLPMTKQDCQLMDTANRFFTVLSMQRLAKHSGYAFSGMADVAIVLKQAARIDHFSQWSVDCISAENKCKSRRPLASLGHSLVVC